MIVSIKGRLSAGPDLQSFRETLVAAVDSGNDRLVLDCSDVGYVDSTGIEAVIAVYQQAEAAGGGVPVLRPGVKLKQLLKLTKLTAVLGVVEDEGEAIDSLLSP
jgi:anti-sigma B factor antagonist